MTTLHTKNKPTVVVETCKRASQSEFPYRVFSYQFKDLDAARKFSRELKAIPRTTREDKVEMYHRHVEVVKTITDEKGKTTAVVVPVLLDVTTDSPEVAEAKWVKP